MNILQEIKEIHLNPQAIEDAGGEIDKQLLEEHRIILIKKVGELAEKMRVQVRLERQDKIKKAKKEIKSEDELKQEIKNIQRWTEIGENTINLLEKSKIKELQDV